MCLTHQWSPTGYTGFKPRKTKDRQTIAVKVAKVRCDFCGKTRTVAEEDLKYILLGRYKELPPPVNTTLDQLPTQGERPSK